VEIPLDMSDIPIASVDENGNITILRHVFFECTICTDCCRLNNIPATEKDMVRLMEAGIPVDQAVEEMSPVLIASRNLEKGFVKAYLLRKKPFVNECAFLLEDGLCKVHLVKPLACQLYPFSVRKDDEMLLATVHPKNVCRFIELDVEEERSRTLAIVEELLAKLFD
jgi:Fe-S-cluster containining protein